jgi:hypothetical protein
LPGAKDFCQSRERNLKFLFLAGVNTYVSEQPKKKGTYMNMGLSLRITDQPFNTALKDGTAGSKLNRIHEATKPEAVRFTGLQPVYGKLDRLEQFYHLVLAFCGILAIGSILFL